MTATNKGVTNEVATNKGPANENIGRTRDAKFSVLGLSFLLLLLLQGLRIGVGAG